MLLATALLIGNNTAQAVGWPANYEGVMLQGFYWDSYKGTNTTKWTDLTSRSDELSKYFKLIWVINCSQANGESYGGNGYMPIYWFSHHRCAFGTEAELKTMISTFKSKGTGFIEDVVINHRVGVSDWADFPAETWNGVTYQLKGTDVCSTDEWTGTKSSNPDTGDDFNGARDLDHKSSNVQANCKAYCKYLLDELGFVGFRLDMVKGYGGEYTKIYNQYSKPQFCVGEYWDGSYDAVKGWIDATGKESAAFDFPFKYQVNKCFNGGAHNYNELVWKANGTNDQPAGMIHYGYSQLAVTFIDNHDTYRDGSKMTGDVLQANAFMLSSPGTPCVFWPHYTAYKTQIQAMIDARNGVGIHNCSAVKVLEVNSNCYVAEVTGTKGKLWIKLGSSSKTAGSGYTKKAAGNGYEIWTTGEGGSGNIENPDGPIDIYFKDTKGWTTPHIYHWGSTEPTWPGVKMTAVAGNAGVYSYTCPKGTTGILFNAGDGDATKTGDFIAMHNHLYTVDGDQGEYNAGGGSTETPGQLYLIGNIPVWNPSNGIELTKSGSKFTGKVTLSAAGTDTAPDPYSYFSFATAIGSTWGDLNGSDRYGAPTKDCEIAINQSSNIRIFAANVDASSAYSWKIQPGTYTMTVDFSTMKLTVTDSTGVEYIYDVTKVEGEPQWFNLHGQRVENPTNGIFIRLLNGKAEKVVR